MRKTAAEYIPGLEIPSGDAGHLKQSLAPFVDEIWYIGFDEFHKFLPKFPNLFPYLGWFDAIEDREDHKPPLFLAFHNLAKLFETPSRRSIPLRKNHHCEARFFYGLQKCLWNIFSSFKLLVVSVGIDCAANQILV